MGKRLDMKEQTIKDKKQKEFFDIILSKAKEKNFLHHSVIIATGVGKSKILIDLIFPLKEILKFNKILIVVDNIKLRDTNWKEEFYKWKMSDVFEEMVELQTYQTVHKWKKNLSDYLIVADEFDFALTPEYQKFYSTYKDCNMLAMSGFVTEGKVSLREKYFPCIIEYDQDKSVRDRVVNEYKLILVKYDLGKEKNIEVKNSKQGKPFMTSENASYNYWDKELRKALGELNKLRQEGDLQKIEAFSRRIQFRESRQLTTMLSNLTSSRRLARQILNEIRDKSPTDKSVVFSVRREQSNLITPHTYHGGNTQAVNEKNFNEFNLGHIRELGLVDKINRGVNMVNLKYAIMESYFGSDTKLEQRIGRLLRLEYSELAYVVILLPYFMRKNMNGYTQAPTLAVKWAMNMLQNKDLSKATIRDFRQIKSDL